MEQNQNPQSVKDLFTQVQAQLNLSLQSRNARSAQQALSMAESVMAKIEGMILADPMVNDEHIRYVVEYTRGPAWNQARQHAATLN